MNPLISLFVFMFRRSLKSPKTQASSDVENWMIDQEGVEEAVEKAKKKAKVSFL